MAISTFMSGYFGRNFASFGQRIEWTAWSPAVIRMVPAGFSRSSLSDSTAASISSSLEQAFARLGRRDAAGGASQEPKAEPGFEAANGLAQRRLRHAELGCGASEIPLAGDRKEGDQIVQALSGHS